MQPGRTREIFDHWQDLLVRIQRQADDGFAEARANLAAQRASRELRGETAHAASEALRAGALRLRQEIVEAWTRVGAELESVGAGLEPAQRRSLHDRRAEEAKRGQELAEEIDVATHALITHLMAVAASPHDSLDEHDLHLVCHEEALESWLDFVLAERRYRACPTPGPSDFASLLMRVRAYWDRYGAALGRRLPGWNEPCQKAFVAERMDEFITRATR